MSQETPATDATSSERQEETSAMQTDSSELANVTRSWTYDKNSGRTIDLNDQWLTWERKSNKETTRIKAPAVTQSTQQPATPPPPRKPRMPPLPLDDIKIVYRPQAGLELAKWSLVAVTHAVGRASGIMQK